MSRENVASHATGPGRAQRDGRGTDLVEEVTRQRERTDDEEPPDHPRHRGDAEVAPEEPLTRERARPAHPRLASTWSSGSERTSIQPGSPLTFPPRAPWLGRSSSAVSPTTRYGITWRAWGSRGRPRRRAVSDRRGDRAVRPGDAEAELVADGARADVQYQVGLVHRARRGVGGQHETLRSAGDVDRERDHRLIGGVGHPHVQ